MFAQSVQFIMAWTDKLMLGAINTPNVVNGITNNIEEVGIYYAAFKLSMFAAVSLMAVNSIASPKFAEMFAKGDMKGLKKVTQQSTKLIFWTSVVFLLLLLILKKYAWKPILKSVDERNENIKEALRAAEKAKEEMAALNANNENILKKSKVASQVFASYNKSI